MVRNPPIPSSPILEKTDTLENRYKTRGIPYRRRYLFHGPPGCGKSSLAYALAGFFGLEIHFVSLMDKQLDEQKLAQLFSELPHKCLVLIEDIDAAGLVRDMDDTNEESDDEDDSVKIDKSPWDTYTTAVRAAREKAGPKPSQKKSSSFSLSGLLNIIDGNFSHISY
jgi:chaperone BCS1